MSCRGWILQVVITLAASSAQAQTIVDDSGRDVPAPAKARIIAAVTDGLNDPMSAQIRRLRVAPMKLKAGFSAYCGEINGKNLMGAYVGFRPFLIDTTGGASILHPKQPGESKAEFDLRKGLFEMLGCTRNP